MKRLVPIANFFLYPILRLYWRICHPVSTGVKVFVKYQDKVLFVHHSYGRKEWTLPGGGVKKGEVLEDAAKREVREEAGIVLNTVILKGSFLFNGEGKQDTIHVFYAEVENPYFKIDNFEIQDASWESIEELTLRGSPIAKRCIEIAGYGDAGKCQMFPGY